MRDGGFEARPRAGGVNSRRLTRWQLRNIDRAANDARAAGDRAVQVHGVVRYLWYPEKQPQQAQDWSSVGSSGHPLRLAVARARRQPCPRS